MVHDLKSKIEKMRENKALKPSNIAVSIIKQWLAKFIHYFVLRRHNSLLNHHFFSFEQELKYLCEL